MITRAKLMEAIYTPERKQWLDPLDASEIVSDIYIAIERERRKDAE